MTRNYLFARGINIIALAHFYIVNLLFCCPCLCVCLDCPQNITLMFIFQQFFTKIRCDYYNIRNFVSVKLPRNTVVFSTTITFVPLQFISQNKKDPFRGIIPRYLTLSGKKKTGNCEENRSFVECGVILAIFLCLVPCITFLFRNYPYYMPTKRLSQQLFV